MSWCFVSELPELSLSKCEEEEFERYARQRARARFYADENFPAQAVELLRARKIDVITAAYVGKCGHPDETHVAEAQRRRRVLLSCDKDFLDERRFPLIHCPTIVVFDFGNGSRTEIVKAYRCLNTILRFPQFYGWRKIHAKPETWTEYSRFQDGTSSRDRYRTFQGRFQVWVEDEAD